MRLTRRRSLSVLPALAALTGQAVAQPKNDDDDDPPMTIKLVALDIGGTLIADHGEVPDAMLCDAASMTGFLRLSVNSFTDMPELSV